MTSAIGIPAFRKTGGFAATLAALVLTAAGAAAPGDGAVYQCDLSNGRKAFQDRPCPAGAQQSHARLSNGVLVMSRAKAPPAPAAPQGAALSEGQIVLLEIEKNAVMARMNNEIEALLSAPTLDEGARQQRINLVRATSMSQIQALDSTVAQARALLPGATAKTTSTASQPAQAAIPPIDAPGLTLANQSTTTPESP